MAKLLRDRRLWILLAVCVILWASWRAYASHRDERLVYQCVSNLREIYKAVRLYAQDWDGCIPPYSNYEVGIDTDGSKLMEITEQWEWNPDRYKTFRWRVQPERLVQALKLYLSREDVWFCPADRHARKHTPANLRFLWRGKDVTLIAPIDHRYTSYAFMPGPAIFAPVKIDHPPSIPMRRSPKDLVIVPRPWGVLWEGNTYLYVTCTNHLQKGDVLNRKITLFLDGTVRITRSGGLFGYSVRQEEVRP